MKDGAIAATGPDTGASWPRVSVPSTAGGALVVVVALAREPVVGGSAVEPPLVHATDAAITPTNATASRVRRLGGSARMTTDVIETTPGEFRTRGRCAENCCDHAPRGRSPTNRHHVAVLVAVTIGASVPAATPAGAWPGDADPAFGTCGEVALDVVPGASSRALAGAAAAGNRMLVAGETGTEAFVMQLVAGVPDPTFGTGGTTRVAVSGSGRYEAVASTSDGGAVAAGRRDSGGTTDSIVVKLKSNGRLDTSFGGNGKLVVDAGGNDGAVAVLVSSADGVIVGGNAGSGGYVARYTAAGAPDVAWDGDGRRSGLNFEVRAIATRADGSVWVAGATASTPANWRIVRLTGTGSTDASFGGSNGVTVDAGGHDVATAIVGGPNGSVVVAGFGAAATGHGKTLVRRFLDDGTEDPAFTRFREAFGVDDAPVGVVRTSGGKLVIAANSAVGGDNDLVALRLDADGTPDTTFGIDGASVVDAGRRSTVRGIDVASDGRPIAVGSVRRSGRDRIALFGFQADESANGAPTTGVVVDAFGGVHGWSSRCLAGAPAIVGNPYWLGWDIARGIAVLPGGGGIVVDAWGGAHTFAIGDGAKATVRGNPYWVGWDIVRGVAVVPEGTGGYELDGFGGLHPFSVGAGPTPPRITGIPYWLGSDMARGIALMPDGRGGYVVDRTGRLYPFGGAPAPNPGAASWPGQDVARAVVIAPDGSGGWVLDYLGGIHPFGTGGDPAPAATRGGPYWPVPLARGAAGLP